MSFRSNFLIDWGLLVPVLVLIILSLTTIFSIQLSLFINQLLFFCVALLFYFVFSYVDFRAIQLYTLSIYIISFILLLILFLVGVESRGAVRWIDIFGIRIQFSEILKPFLGVSLVSYLSNLEKISAKSFFVILVFLLPIALLIYFQPDLGNALLYIAVTIAILITVGYPLSWFGIGLLSFLLLLPILWRFLHEYQRQRILTFFEPSKDPLGSSYNVIQAIIAVGSGLFFGKSISEVTQSRLRFLPERHTDFIFATFSEGFGFLGSFVLLTAFFLLLRHIYFVYENSQNRFCKLFAAFSFFAFLVPIFVNIGMNIGLLPITGVTLPFMSYGGSSLLSNFIILGILSSIKRGIKRDDPLEIY